MSANNTNNELKNRTILNSRLPDSSSKLIFDEPILCAQFLRGYIEGIPCLKDVRPEDIEDVSEQYVPLFSEERNSDRVKKVHIKNGTPFFLVSLIEHKTKVEYNVIMQIFRYMVYIWETYEKEEEKREKGISRRRDFRYPPILPIVYYEGRQKWTVPLDFKSRIIEGDAFARYIPNFQYYLVPLREYSNQELLDREDEISLVMLVNRLQELGDISSFRSLPQEQLEAVLKDTPDHIAGIIADILLAFLLKSRIPAETAEEISGKVREKKMGELFADMEPIDIPAEQAKIREQRQEMNAQQREMEAQRQEMNAQQQEMDAQQREMDAQRREMDAQQQAMDAQRQEMDAQQQAMDAKWREMDTQQQAMDAKWREMDTQQQAMDAKWREMDAQQQAMDAKWREMDAARLKMEAEFKAEQQRITAQRQELEKMKQDIEAEMELLKNTHNLSHL